MKNRTRRIVTVAAVAAAGVVAAGGIAIAHDHDSHHGGHNKFHSDQDYGKAAERSNDFISGIPAGLTGVNGGYAPETPN